MLKRIIKWWGFKSNEIKRLNLASSVRTEVVKSLQIRLKDCHRLLRNSVFDNTQKDNIIIQKDEEISRLVAKKNKLKDHMRELRACNNKFLYCPKGK